MAYTIDVTRLLEAGDNYHCNIDNIRAGDGPGLRRRRLPDRRRGGAGQRQFDRRSPLTTIRIKDPQTGHMWTDTHAVTRMAFADYFVARTGLDGNHKVCMLSINPYTGDLSYDSAFVDEELGTPCVDYNRRNWPGGATTGYYKPHSMTFVEDDPPKTGGIRSPNGNISGYWGDEIDNASDTGGFPYAE
jgi:hypothetical protein